MANQAAVTDTSEQAVQERYAPEACWREVERLLYREARLLDAECLSDWLHEIVDPTIRYVVVSRELRFRKERRYTRPDEVFIYDDDYDYLKARVDQFHSDMQWRVDPPERYRRLVTNVEVFETEVAGELSVRSNCLAMRARRAYEVDQFVYCRDDRFRRCALGTLRLVQRRIDFDERSVAGRNLALIL